MKASQKQHYHTLERVAKSQNQFRCRAPECNFVWVKKFLIGKRVHCNQCTELFLLDTYSLKLKHPICKKCSTAKNYSENTGHTMESRKTEQIIQGIFNLHDAKLPLKDPEELPDFREMFPDSKEDGEDQDELVF